MFNVQKYPRTKDQLFGEIKKVFNAYDSQELDDDALEGYLHHFAEIDDTHTLGNYTDNLYALTFEASDFSKVRLGKNRARRMEHVLKVKKTIDEEY